MIETIQANQLNILEIMKQIPHRYPFLLIDRVTHFEIGKSIRAIKNVTMNEQFFVGHFPEYPVMPGVLIVEAMAQTAGVLSIVSHGERKENELSFFASIDKARFKRQVTPGDQLVFEVELLKLSRGIGKFSAIARVDGNIVAEAELMIARREV
ncbi:MAG: 3-hydroxyacyl-[acyl-carrier-protein] dehydratase FabZ [Pseudomonadota bacterium]|jgi:3-hydroxyacyl-[acyl-carrier-protein] dehydratase